MFTILPDKDVFYMFNATLGRKEQFCNLANDELLQEEGSLIKLHEGIQKKRQTLVLLLQEFVLCALGFCFVI